VVPRLRDPAPFVPALQAWLSIIPKEGVVCKKGAHLCHDEMRGAVPSCYLVIAQQPCYGLRPR
jgi:hypothetical protein